MCIHKRTLPFPSTELWGEELRKMMSDRFAVVQLLSLVQLFATPWTAGCQASLSLTTYWGLHYPLNQWCHPIISSSVIPFSSCLQCFPASSGKDLSRVFSHESVLQVASGGQSIGASGFSISPCNEHSGLISFRIDRFDLLAVQGTLKSLLQCHSLKAPILQCSAFFIV